MKIVRITHIITGLNTGGAETMLYKLLSRTNIERFCPEVISLTDIGPVGKKIEKLGIRVRALGMRRGIPDPRALFKLAGWLKRERPHLVQTWMYHADLVGGLAARLTGGIPVVWGIHHSNLDPEGNKRLTIWTARMCARFSWNLPVKIVCCSEASRRLHASLGYDPGKMVVIPNGFELSVFAPNPNARVSVRRELGISEKGLIIGLVARFHPQKDHHNFVRAAGLLCSAGEDAYFLLCGDGVTWENQELVSWIEKAGVTSRFRLLGRREDVSRLTAAMDIATLSSFAEAFPNVVGEAMACGVPCVVTDVGDSAAIVGETGIVVPSRSPEALAAAWRKMIAIGPEGRAKLGAAARKRVLENFDLAKVVTQYERIYREVTALSSH